MTAADTNPDGKVELFLQLLEETGNQANLRLLQVWSYSKSSYVPLLKENCTLWRKGTKVNILLFDMFWGIDLQNPPLGCALALAKGNL